MKRNHLIGVLLGLLLLSACVSRRTALIDYEETFYRHPPGAENLPLVVCILVDGLSLGILEKNLERGRAENLKRFFLPPGEKVHQGRALFPTLTYPNIASLLTARPVDEHPIIGNKMKGGDHFVDFEKIQDRGELNDALEKISVFAAVTRHGLKSISLAHFFRAGATIHYRSDIDAALSYLSKEYLRVDDKLIESLSTLLITLPPPAWPSFIFLHAAAIDSLAHLDGPEAPTVADYLEQLDQKLGKVFELLSSAEEHGKPIIVLLTADHGFVPFHRYFDIDAFFKNIRPTVKYLNETRFVSIYFAGAPADARDEILKRLPQNPELEMYLERRQNTIYLTAREFSATLTYSPKECSHTDYGIMLNESPVLCPEAFDEKDPPFVSPFFVSNIATYFHSPYHPDALLLASRETSFDKAQKGGHGGFTQEEILVPILLHGASISNEKLILPTYQLLAPLAAPKP